MGGLGVAARSTKAPDHITTIPGLPFAATSIPGPFPGTGKGSSPYRVFKIVLFFIVWYKGKKFKIVQDGLLSPRRGEAGREVWRGEREESLQVEQLYCGLE